MYGLSGMFVDSIVPLRYMRERSNVLINEKKVAAQTIDFPNTVNLSTMWNDVESTFIRSELGPRSTTFFLTS